MAIKFWPRNPDYITIDVQRELHNHSTFHHPNVIGFKQVILTPTHIGLVLEYASGGDLYKKVNKCGGLPVSHVPAQTTCNLPDCWLVTGTTAAGAADVPPCMLSRGRITLLLDQTPLTSAIRLSMQLALPVEAEHQFSFYETKSLQSSAWQARLQQNVLKEMQSRDT